MLHPFETQFYVWQKWNPWNTKIMKMHKSNMTLILEHNLRYLRPYLVILTEDLIQQFIGRCHQKFEKSPCLVPFRWRLLCWLSIKWHALLLCKAFHKGYPNFSQVEGKRGTPLYQVNMDPFSSSVISVEGYNHAVVYVRDLPPPWHIWLRWKQCPVILWLGLCGFKTSKPLCIKLAYFALLFNDHEWC